MDAKKGWTPSRGPKTAEPPNAIPRVQILGPQWIPGTEGVLAHGTTGIRLDMHHKGTGLESHSDESLAKGSAGLHQTIDSAATYASQSPEHVAEMAKVGKRGSSQADILRMTTMIASTMDREIRKRSKR